MAKITKEDIIDDIQTDFAYDIIGDMNPFKKGRNVISLSPPNLISDIQKKDKARRAAYKKKGPMFKIPGGSISDLVRDISKKSYNEGAFVEVPVKLARNKKTRLY
tara:strand:+ start:284 stop:598 length:315 start_codon:yes stop_codon:yes gene_type:complete